jgi:hypothetical protein
MQRDSKKPKSPQALGLFCRLARGVVCTLLSNNLASSAGAFVWRYDPKVLLSSPQEPQKEPRWLDRPKPHAWQDLPGQDASKERRSRRRCATGIGQPRRGEHGARAGAARRDPGRRSGAGHRAHEPARRKAGQVGGKTGRGERGAERRNREAHRGDGASATKARRWPKSSRPGSAPTARTERAESATIPRSVSLLLRCDGARHATLLVLKAKPRHVPHHVPRRGQQDHQRQPGPGTGRSGQWPCGRLCRNRVGCARVAGQPTPTTGNC